MKNIKRLAAALRAAGVILLALALVVTFYSLASGGATWTPMRDKLVSVGAEAGFGSRLRFDVQVYAAMSDCAANKDLPANQRAAAIEPYFASFAETGSQAESARLNADAQAVITYFETEFDAAAYVERYASREGMADEKMLTELFDYIDGLSAPPALPGKKLPNLKLADNRPAFEEQHAALVEAYGDEAGSFAEFTQAAANLIKAEIANGGAVTDAAAWIAENMPYEVYQAELANVREADADEESANIVDAFAALAEKKAAGEQVDFAVFLQDEYAALEAAYAGEKLPSYEMFVPVMRTLLESSTFDGSYVSVYKALGSAQDAADASSFRTFMKEFCATVVSSADRGSSIPVVGIFWRMVSLTYLLAIIGVALLILGRIADYALSRALIARREKRKIEEEKDVLLRVNNLKQYCNAKKIIAFGDNLNDLPMFEAADYSVAVKNAHPTLLKSADAVAEHGVVEWIKDYIKQS